MTLAERLKKEREKTSRTGGLVSRLVEDLGEDYVAGRMSETPSYAQEQKANLAETIPAVKSYRDYLSSVERDEKWGFDRQAYNEKKGASAYDYALKLLQDDEDRKTSLEGMSGLGANDYAWKTGMKSLYANKALSDSEPAIDEKYGAGTTKLAQAAVNSASMGARETARVQNVKDQIHDYLKKYPNGIRPEEWNARPDTEDEQIGWTAGKYDQGRAGDRAARKEQKQKRIEEINTELENLDRTLYDPTYEGYAQSADEMAGIDERRNALTEERDRLLNSITQYERTQEPFDRYGDVYNKVYYNDPEAKKIIAETKEKAAQNPDEFTEWLSNKKSGTLLTDAMFIPSQDANETTAPWLNFYRSWMEPHASWFGATQTEIDTYYYILGTQGEKAAKAYLDSMEDVFGKRTSENYQEDLDRTNILNKAFLVAATSPARAASGIVALGDQAKDMLTESKIHPYSGGSLFQRAGTQTVSSVANDLDEMTNHFSIGNQTLGKAYQAGVSGFDSMVQNFSLGPVSTVFMGMGAAAQEAADLWERGATNEQIAVGGTLAGVAETLFEYLSLEMLFKNFIEAPPTARADFWKKFALQLGIEGSEEWFTDSANMFTDMVNMRSASEWSQLIESYKDRGLSDNNAFKQAAKDTLLERWDSFVGGAIGAAIGVGGATMYNAYRNRQTGQDIISGGGLEETIGTAEDLLNAEGRNAITDPAARLALEEAARRAANGKATDVGYLRTAIDNAVEAGYDSTEARVAAAEKTGNAETYIVGHPVPHSTDLTKAVTADGETVTIDKSNPIVRFEENSEGKTVAILNTNKGEMSVDDLAFEDNAARLAYDTAKDFDSVETANAVLDNYQGGDVARYIAGMREGIELHGKMNVPSEAISYYSSLSKENQAYATKLGQTLRKNMIDTAVKAAKEGTTQNFKAANGEKLQKTFSRKGAFGTNGSVYTYGDVQAATKEDKQARATVGRVADITGLSFILYDSNNLKSDNSELGRSLRNADGKYVYRNGAIYVDISAGPQKAQGLVAYALAHELTHSMEQWAREEYDAYADWLIKNYSEITDENGNRVTSMEDLVKMKMVREGKGYEDAFHEVVADASSRMLIDTDVLEKLEELREKDPNVFKRVVAQIRKFVKSLSKIYDERFKGVQPTESALTENFSDEGLRKLRELWVEGAVKTAERRSAAVERSQEGSQAVADMGININKETESANPDAFSLKTWEESDYVQNLEVAAKELAEELGVSLKDARKYIRDVNSIAKIIAADRARLDFDAAPGLSAFISNVEYGGSIDFSTICKKRRLMTGTMGAIQEAIGNTPLSITDFLNIRNMMKAKGYEVSCGLCYVEGSRAQMGKFAAQFRELYQKYNPDAEWIPTQSDLVTPDKVEKMRTEHPDVYEEYEHFWNNHGKLREGDPNLFASQQKPKLFQADTEYNGEILNSFRGKNGKVDKEAVKAKNRNGGLRIQSFSDFEIIHLLDCMQVITDMSRVGLAGQAYTKVADFARALGPTGLKINLSLIAKGVDENGNIILDEVEGMKKSDAEDLRNKYSDNVGTILVVFNDAQLKAALNDPFIDFIIPFHRSQWASKYYDAMGLPGKVKDFTSKQNEKLLRKTYHEFRGRMVADKARNFMPNEYWEFDKDGKYNAEKYLRMCAEQNKKPKFDNLLVNNGDGSYSLQPDGSTDGYWKLLIDFKMYNNEGKGAKQMPVKPQFDIKESNRMLDEYEGGHQTYPVAQDIVDEFLKSRNSDKSKSYVSPEDSARYLELAKDPEKYEAELSRMVETAARAAGYDSPMLYHGTQPHDGKGGFGFTTFNMSKADDGSTIFLTDSDWVAESYAGTLNKRNASGAKFNALTASKEAVIKKFNELNAHNYAAKLLSQHDVEELRNQYRTAIQKNVDDINTLYRVSQDKQAVETLKLTPDDVAVIKLLKNIADEFDNAKSPKELKEARDSYKKLARMISQNLMNLYSVLVDGEGFSNAAGQLAELNKLAGAKGDIVTIGKGGYAFSLESFRHRLADDLSYEDDKGIYSVYTNTDNFLMVDCAERNWDELRLPKELKSYAPKGHNIYYTTRDVAALAKEAGYRGVIFEDVTDVGEDAYDYYPSNVYAVFDSENVKSADPVTYDDNGNVIPLEERFNPENEDIRHSSKSKSYVSDREILANALQNATENSKEYAMLERYKQNAEQLDKLQEDLDRVNGQIRRLTFERGDKGPLSEAEKVKLRGLREEATKIRNRIAIMDSRLVKIAKAAPIRRLIDTERLNSYRKGRDKGKEVARTQEKRRELRQKIKSLAANMSNRLLKPKGTQYIPAGLKKAVSDVLTALDIDSGRSESLTAKLTALNAKYKEIASDPKYQAAYDKSVEEMFTRVTEAISVAEADNAKRGKRHGIYGMNSDTLEAVYKALRAFDYVVRDSVKQHALGSALDENLTTHDVGEKLIEETNAVKDRSNLRKKLAAGYQVRPSAFFNRLAGFKKDSYWMRVYRMLDAAQLKKTMIEMESEEIFKDILNDEKYLRKLVSTDKKKLVDIGLKSANGKTVPITRGMMLSLYMHLLNEDNARHLAVGGITIPNLALYYKGDENMFNSGNVRIPGFVGAELNAAYKEIQSQIEDLDNRWEDAAVNNDFDRLDAIDKERAALWGKRDAILEKGKQAAEQLRKTIEGKLSDKDRAFIAAAREYFDNYSKTVLNEATMQMYGFEKASVENYFPIHTDKNFLKATWDNISGDFSLEGSGFMKDRLKNATTPLLLEDFSQAINSQISKVARYAGLAPALREFGKLYGIVSGGVEFTTSVQEAVEEKFGKAGAQYISNLVADLNGSSRFAEKTLPQQFIARARSNMAKAVLSANAPIAVKQATSLWTAIAELDHKSVIKAIVKPGKGGFLLHEKSVKEIQEKIAKNTPLLWKRSQGYTDVSLAEARGLNDVKNRVDKKMRWLTGWIEAVDTKTVRRLWYASEYWVEDHTDLKRGTEEFDLKVTEKFNDVVEKTQPNYTVMQRPAVLRSQSEIVKSAAMFMTQRLQNYNIVYEAVGTYAKYSSDYRAGMKAGLGAGINNVTKEDVAEARTAAVRAVSSQIGSAMILSAMTLAGAALTGGMWRYRDKDGEVTPESVAWGLVERFLNALAGNVLGGSEIYDLISNLIQGKEWYGFSFGGIDTIEDVVKHFGDLMTKIAKGEADKVKPWKDVATDATTMFGIPASNVYKLANGLRMIADDVAHGNFGAFEADGELWEWGKTIKRTAKQNGRIMLDAHLNGDEERFEKAHGNFSPTKTETAEEKADDALEDAAYEAWAKGDLSGEDAARVLEDKLGMSDNEVRIKFERWTEKKENGEVDKHYTEYGTLRNVFREYAEGQDLTATGPAKEMIAQYREYGYTDEQIRDAIGNEFRDEYKAADNSGRLAIQKFIVQLYELAGKKRDDALKLVNGWVKDKK